MGQEGAALRPGLLKGLQAHQGSSCPRARGRLPARALPGGLVTVHVMPATYPPPSQGSPGLLGVPVPKPETPQLLSFHGGQVSLEGVTSPGTMWRVQAPGAHSGKSALTGDAMCQNGVSLP